MTLMFRDFKRLRVLKVKGIVCEDSVGLTLSKEIEDMVHRSQVCQYGSEDAAGENSNNQNCRRRFLSLRNCVINFLPAFIRSLILPQTLDFRVICLHNIYPNIPNFISWSTCDICIYPSFIGKALHFSCLLCTICRH